jgi:hypothetical protein
MYSLNGIPVILSEHMTDNIIKKIYRNYRLGQRRGRDKSSRRLVCTKPYTIPSKNVMVANGMAVIHPDTFYRMKAEMDNEGAQLAEKICS